MHEEGANGNGASNDGMPEGQVPTTKVEGLSFHLLRPCVDGGQ